MATLRNLKIKTGTCRRIIKELHSYEKEVEREAAKTANMKEKGADPYDLKQQVYGYCFYLWHHKLCRYFRLQLDYMTDILLSLPPSPKLALPHLLLFLVQSGLCNFDIPLTMWLGVEQNRFSIIPSVCGYITGDLAIYIVDVLESNNLNFGFLSF